MATTALWKIESSLANVIDYTKNPEKTLNKEYGKELYDSLHETIEYAKNGYKTEKMFYVSGINCLTDNAYEDMMMTKKEYNKMDGIVGYHGYQSFKGTDISPDIVHEIGMKLAEEMWGDKYEVLVSTHLDTENYHNHFVVNSVSFIDGKKYNNDRRHLASMRHLSDSLCLEYGLDVLEEKKTRKNINYSNYYKGYVQKSPYYQTAKADIDRAIGMAVSYKDFENLLKQMDYEIIYRNKNIMIVRREPYKKNIRVQRSFGDDYSIKSIEQRIKDTNEVRVPFIKSLGIKTYLKNVPEYNPKKHKGLYGLYLHYCYLFGIIEEKKTYTKLSPRLKEEVKKMESLSKQAILLAKNNIETSSQFYEFKESVLNKGDSLIDERINLWKKYKSANSEEEKSSIKSKINEINSQIKKEKETLKLCTSIEDRATTIETEIKEVKREIKEEKENELIK